MDIGERIVSARKSHGWSQLDLAGEMGVAQSTVANWERGARGLSAETLMALSAALGVTVSWLLGVADTPEANSLTREERRLVSLYRASDPRGRQTIMQAAESQAGMAGELPSRLMAGA